MPFINGCFFSKKAINRDNDFLKAQGLSETQISAVSAYFLQRLSAHSYHVINQGGVIFLLCIGIGIMILRH